MNKGSLCPWGPEFILCSFLPGVQRKSSSKQLLTIYFSYCWGFPRHTPWSRTSGSFSEKSKGLVRWWWMRLVKDQGHGWQVTLALMPREAGRYWKSHPSLDFRALTLLHFSFCLSSPPHLFLSSICFFNHFLATWLLSTIIWNKSEYNIHHMGWIRLTLPA